MHEPRLINWQLRGNRKAEESLLTPFPKALQCKPSGSTTAESHTHRTVIPCTSDCTSAEVFGFALSHGIGIPMSLPWKQPAMGFISVYNYELVSLTKASACLSVDHIFVYHHYSLPIGSCWLSLVAKKHFILNLPGLEISWESCFLQFLVSWKEFLEKFRWGGTINLNMIGTIPRAGGLDW